MSGGIPVFCGCSSRKLSVCGTQRDVRLVRPALESAAAQPETDPLLLNSRAAVLLDGDTGRILYGKNETEVLPMASTTKIMTCILALENAGPDTEVLISDRAASMPEVKLHVRKGERYCLRDLLYSMMLESHNDSAAAIAEAVGGSVENFADMMNRKAVELGCEDTYFLTPNGLDANGEGERKDPFHNGGRSGADSQIRDPALSGEGRISCHHKSTVPYVFRSLRR